MRTGSWAWGRIAAGVAAPRGGARSGAPRAAAHAGGRPCRDHLRDQGLPWVPADTPRPGAGLGRLLTACGKGRWVLDLGSERQVREMAQGWQERACVLVCVPWHVSSCGGASATTSIESQAGVLGPPFSCVAASPPWGLATLDHLKTQTKEQREVLLSLCGKGPHVNRDIGNPSFACGRATHLLRKRGPVDSCASSQHCWTPGTRDQVN